MSPMELLTIHSSLDEVAAEVADAPEVAVVLALDGWTDAGRGGTLAAEALTDQLSGRVIGGFDADALYDYRDRRPVLGIDRGVLDDPEWPALEVHLLTPEEGCAVVLVTGAEPDFRWQTLCGDVVKLAEGLGVDRYVGMGAVPGPIPHTRPSQITVTSNDTDLLERLGRPHERMVVPASCQVVVETALRDAGIDTLGLWARIPHYVAGEYPEGARLLLQRLAQQLELPIDPSVFDADVEEQRDRLDIAAQGSPDVESHIEQLEEAYDSNVDAGEGFGGPLPTGEQIAAEFEQFLRDQSD